MPFLLQKHLIQLTLFKKRTADRYFKHVMLKKIKLFFNWYDFIFAVSMKAIELLIVIVFQGTADSQRALKAAKLVYVAILLTHCLLC